MNMENSRLPARRDFLRGGMVFGLAAADASPSASDPKDILNYNPGMAYRRLDNTRIHFSLLSLGGLVMVEAVYHHAIEQGMNFVDASPSYRGGLAIRQLGNVLKSRRTRVYVACKYHSYVRFEDNLRDLQTDWVDFIVFNHHDRHSALHNDDREVFEKLKKAGKVRYAALMTHGDVKEVIAIGIRNGLYSFVTPALNQPGLEAFGEEIRTAQQKGIGVVAMKALRGLENTPLQLALLKKLARSGGITSVLTSIGSYEVFDSYRQALLQPLTAREDRALYAHSVAARSRNCMMCDACKQACPRDLEISAVLRCHDYYYGQLQDAGRALSAYREIPAGKRSGTDCGNCRLCESVCPNGIRIVERMEAARETFARLA